MATITFQNLFRLYKKLAGMTGTADTEADGVPQDLQARRRRHPDEQADGPHGPRGRRLQDRAREVHARSSTRSSSCHEQGPAGPRRHDQRREERGRRARSCKKKGIPHTVLNAKHHEHEAYVVAQAGRKGAITVSHQHGRPRHRHHPRRQRRDHGARRGRRPRGGGDPRRRSTRARPSSRARSTKYKRAVRRREATRCVAAGGLHILGTERHESRRIDNQLRGRAGRQGDPGVSRFYLSLEDDLMRIFARRPRQGLMERMGMPDDEPIEHPWVTKSDRERAEARSRSTTSTSARTCSSTTT